MERPRYNRESFLVRYLMLLQECSATVGVDLKKGGKKQCCLCWI